jgi:hypothetical protein
MKRKMEGNAISFSLKNMIIIEYALPYPWA